MSEFHEDDYPIVTPIDWDDCPEALPVDSDDFPEVLPLRKGVTWLAWGGIAFAVAVTLAMPHLRVIERLVPRSQETVVADGAQLVALHLQARLLLGYQPFLTRTEEKDTLYRQAQAYNSGTVRRRLSFITFAGELKGPKEALRSLADLRDELKRHRVQPTLAERDVMKNLQGLYQAYEQGNWRPFEPASAEALAIEAELGWFGKLALAPGGAPAGKPTIGDRTAVSQDVQRTFFGIMGIAVFLGALLLLGGIGLLLLFIFAIAGSVTGGVKTGSYHGGVYAETFALWMILFLALDIVAPALAPKGWLFGTLGLCILASLVVLIWPVLRGIPWRTMREDIGWTLGRASVFEPFVGIGAYAMSLPFLVAGLIAMVVLMRLTNVSLGMGALLGQAGPFDPPEGPSHPIVSFFLGFGWQDWLQIAFVAAVVAPIVEETMFRGVLYRHLRELTHQLPMPLSFFLCAVAVSFIFAVIHPQGFIAVPALMALAFGLTIAREWRGSLLSCMVAHGIHNGLLISAILLAVA